LIKNGGEEPGFRGEEVEDVDAAAQDLEEVGCGAEVEEGIDVFFWGVKLFRVGERFFGDHFEGGGGLDGSGGFVMRRFYISGGGE